MKRSYLDFLKQVSAEEDNYHECIFIGGKIIHNKAVTMHLDITINCDRLRLDLKLSDSGKGFLNRFPNLGAIYAHIGVMLAYFRDDGRVSE